MLNSANDKYFIELLRQNDSSAYDRLYGEFFRPLCFFAENLTGDGQAAQDLVTESFVKLLQYTPPVETTQQLKSWLYTITRNACFDYVRAVKRHRHSHEELGYLQNENEENAERQMIRAEVLQAIYMAIESLPERNRTVVKLALIEGKKNEEIAADLQMSDQTVRNRKSEGMQMLRIALKDQYGLTPTAILMSFSLVEFSFF